ncbi:hypothetical protein R1sor_018085 [Riccia sorocarpa]|uniref:Uncharacterized protein n=1 Tax=Riccia sorocarpa TaxID=122646 RepID=A0ABD3I8P0_9MARC
MGNLDLCLDATFFGNVARFINHMLAIIRYKVEAENIEVAENFRAPLPTALDGNRDMVHDTLDDNSRVVLEVETGKSPDFQPVENVHIISSSNDEIFSLEINIGECLRIQVKADSRVVNIERLQPSEFDDCAKFVKPVAEDFIVKTEFIDEADANDKEAVSTFRTSCPCFLNFQVNCARYGELFIARKTKFNP